jgi:hypothetical protein
MAEFLHDSSRMTAAGPMTNADNRNQGPGALSRHSGMPLAGIQSAVFLDSGQNRAGMTEG